MLILKHDVLVLKRERREFFQLSGSLPRWILLIIPRLLLTEKISQRVNQLKGSSCPLNRGKSNIANLGTIGALLEELDPAQVELAAPYNFKARLWVLPSEMNADCLVLTTTLVSSPILN